MPDDDDISDLIAPKSDQLNGDDFVTGPVDVTILAAKRSGTPQQPVWLTVSGYDRPWKPCKTTLRLMAEAWKTTKTQEWVGKSARLFRDPSVVYGGKEVGGIRVSHLSHIERGFATPVSISKAVKRVWKIDVLPAQPLAVEAPKPAASGVIPNFIKSARDAAGRGTDAFRVWCKANPAWRDIPAATMEELRAVCQAADDADDPVAAMSPDESEAKMARAAQEFLARDDQ